MQEDVLSCLVPLLHFPCRFHSMALSVCFLSVSSPQHVANPTPISMSYFLPCCQLLPCFSPEPYRGTAFTFDSKTLILLLLVTAVPQYSKIACFILTMHAWMSLSVSPFMLKCTFQLYAQCRIQQFK